MRVLTLENIKKVVKDYLEPSHLKNLHLDAFYGVVEIICSFILEGTIAVRNRQKAIAWVCDAIMGSGKTTAVEVLLKYLVDYQPTVSVLLAFNENSLMKVIYEEVYNHGVKKGKYNIIEYVQTENVNEVVHTLSNFQIVCITQQRFRDLALGYGNWNDYRAYTQGTKPFQKSIERLIIVDEKPILFNESVFDISSNDNSVDWFDKMAEESNLTPVEIQFGRTMIMTLMTNEMLVSDREEKRTYTKPLIERIEGAKTQGDFEKIINSIKLKKYDFELLRKLKWFKDLLYHKRIGAIDRHSKGINVICSQLIPYHNRGNILILDGTARNNKNIYEKDYVIKQTINYHNYYQRVKIHIRDINTSKESRENENNDIHSKIASDIKRLEEKLDVKIFPLASKSDVEIYIKNGAIDSEHQKYYEVHDESEDSLPINLLNTKGKEELSDYNAIALLNIPIRNPQFYKINAVGLYGVDCNLEQNLKRQKKLDTSWFVDEQVQKLFEESVLEDVLQIIHRTRLRKLNDNSEVHIVIYTHHIGWGKMLQKALGIPQESISYDIVDDKYNFLLKCKDYAKKTRSFLEKHSDYFTNKQYTAGQIVKGDNFKNFIKKNWDDGYKSEKIKEIFNTHGVEIVLQMKQEGKVWKYFRLNEVTHEKLFPLS